jgi:hypothetical protein
MRPCSFWKSRPCCLRSARSEQLENAARIQLDGKHTLEDCSTVISRSEYDLWSGEPSAKVLRTLLRGSPFWKAYSPDVVPLAVKTAFSRYRYRARGSRLLTPHDADLAMTIANQAADR